MINAQYVSRVALRRDEVDSFDRYPLSRIHDLVLDDSQFIVATHSPILMAYPDAVIYQCDTHGVRRIAYQDTEHFQVMHDFLVHPQRMLDTLLARGGA